MEREFLETLGLAPEAVDAVLEAHEKVVQAHSREMAALQLGHKVSEAVLRAGGRNVKAISALLDMEALSASDDLDAALEAALTDLKADSGYLFSQPMPPRYAPGTGAVQNPQPKVTTLAGALRERMRKKN